jgi:diguanylate cyclase
MSESPPAVILILARHEAAARRWADMLREPGFDVRLSQGDPAEAVTPEVIVTDRDDLDAPEAEQSVAGIVRLETRGPADVWLPRDATARELRLACRLLAEVVRLRRKVHSGVELHDRLREEALTDPLTALPNRRAWDRMVRERLADRRALGEHLCLAILDLDHFKRINDALGHAVGDRVLRAAGEAIRRSLRQDDFVARLGGDEFGLLLRVPEQAAAIVVDRVRLSIAASPPAASGGPTCRRPLNEHGPTPLNGPITASAGLVVVSPGASPLPSHDALWEIADAAMRRAKREGRDRTVRG